MTSDVKLLPLPASRNTVLIRGEGHSGEISASPCEHYFDPDTVLDYARACVAHATAAKDAEAANALEAAREDAARYRWLRDASSAAAPSFVANLCGADLDAAIDAAIDQARGKGVE